MTNQSHSTRSRIHRPGQGRLDTLAVTQTVYGSPAALASSRVPRPVPDAGEVLIEVHAASVNARDWHIMRGEPRVARFLDPTIFGRRGPRVPTRGTDLAGIVAAVGPGVEHWKADDLVFGEGIGAFAQHAVARADQLAAIPSGIGFEVAAAVPLAATTAWLCISAADPTPGSGILINGASGGVGTFAIQLAKARGLHVTAVVSTRNLAQAEDLGADRVIDYTTDSVIADDTYDVVLDLVGNLTLRELRSLLRPHGALVLSGGGVSGKGKDPRTDEAPHLGAALRTLLGSAPLRSPGRAQQRGARAASGIDRGREGQSRHRPTLRPRARGRGHRLPRNRTCPGKGRHQRHAPVNANKNRITSERKRP